MSARATKQLTRSTQVEEIKLDNPNISITKACELMKKLTVVAVSNIAWVRNVFPEEAFKQRKIGPMRVKALCGVREIPGTFKMINWIKSAFEAVQANYLKKMILVIENPNDKSTLETYTFRFTYNLDAITCNLQSETREENIEMDLTCPENVQKKAAQLLRTLVTYTSTLEPLPNGCELGMRLEFYDNVPGDYVLPNNFKVVDSLGIQLPECLKDMVMGKIESKFTSFSVASKSVLDPNREKDEEEAVALGVTVALRVPDALEKPAEEEDDFIPSSQEPSSRVFHKPLSRHSQQTQQQLAPINPAEDSMHSSNATKLSEELSKACLEDRVVKCICGCTDEPHDNLKCESCSTFQHRACYKFLEDQTVPRHICIDCYETNNDSNTWVHPDILTDKDRQASALYRRALVLCLGKARISVTILVHELNIKRRVAMDIFNKLGADGCLSSPSGKGFVRSVKTDYLKHSILSQYFSGDANNEMDTEENNMNRMNIDKEENDEVGTDFKTEGIIMNQIKTNKRKSSDCEFEFEEIERPKRQKKKLFGQELETIIAP